MEAHPVMVILKYMELRNYGVAVSKRSLHEVYMNVSKKGLHEDAAQAGVLTGGYYRVEFNPPSGS